MTTERVQPPAPRSEVEVLPGPGGGQNVERIQALVAEAIAASGSERAEVSGRINALLVSLRTPGNEAGAKALLALLEKGGLDDLVDSSGRASRTEAVETLLGCGFPWALEVRPEDLHFHKEHRHAQAKGPGKLIAGAVVVGLLVLGLGLLSSGPGKGGANPRDWPVALQGAFLIGVLVLRSFFRFKPFGRSKDDGSG